MLEDIPKYVIVPYEKMEELMRKIDKLCEAFTFINKDKNILGEYITENEAKEILSKETTWFWNKRKAGELTGKKAGNKWYYKRSDILKFIENGK